NAEFVVQRRELSFWTSDVVRELEHATHAEPEDIERIAAGRLRLLDGNAQVVPGVDAFCVGGHSPAQTVLRVEGEQGPIVLASDAVHYYEELELERPFAIVHDLDEMRAGYAIVRELAGPGGEIVPGHDPDVMRRYPVLDGGLGVRVV